MTSYLAKAERDGKFWFIDVVGPNFSHATQARSLKEAEAMSRDLVASLLDVKPTEVEVTLEVVLPAEVQRHLTNSAEARALAREANSRAAEESRAAASILSETGMTVRDIGRALGISHQRAHQLISGAVHG